MIKVPLQVSHTLWLLVTTVSVGGHFVTADPEDQVNS